MHHASAHGRVKRRSSTLRPDKREQGPSPLDHETSSMRTSSLKNRARRVKHPEPRTDDARPRISPILTEISRMIDKIRELCQENLYHYTAFSYLSRPGVTRTATKRHPAGLCDIATLPSDGETKTSLHSKHRVGKSTATMGTSPCYDAQVGPSDALLSILNDALPFHDFQTTSPADLNASRQGNGRLQGKRAYPTQLLRRRAPVSNTQVSPAEAALS
ncbi:hypothetical protein DFP72DRAFT_1064315 [Ephemerocybe angulata]|uniref:Uncharacterized protein n=1 Tax=Ephemerocybe angulata TaxID=980116 RepID=A0A8H6I6H9_9AGAR|nr:hypothetical protein DFP72DRAFT_1064315 [Tulosesus angulatus]